MISAIHKNHFYFTTLMLFFIVHFASAQFECPDLTAPVDGVTDVAVSSTIEWTAVAGVPSYLISLGTTPGGTDILDNRTTGSAQYTPTTGLPQNTDIYVTITLFFFNRDNIVCESGMFRTELVTQPPSCTTEIFPAAGSTGIDTSPLISWNHAPTATGYSLYLGTQTGDYDLISDLVIDNALEYQITEALPYNTQIYALIVPFNDIGSAINCTEFSFTTQDETFLPGCTQLSSPADGAINVSLNPLLEWDAVPDADGYRISIGTDPNGNDIVNAAPYAQNFTEVFDFLPSSTFFITIVPFNEAGDAIGCVQTTFTTLLGCGPVEIPTTGEIVSFAPEIDLAPEIALCQNENSTSITSNDNADGYRWYKINTDGTETLLSEIARLDFSELGRYRYEAYNLVTQSGEVFECSSDRTFNVIASELPKITEVQVQENSESITISVVVSGRGDYEFAIDNVDGPYQDSNVFNNVVAGSHTVYVRDKNGCGLAEERVFKRLTSEGFPSFFTPNQDGFNDFWQFLPSPETGEINVEYIRIYDRYGQLIRHLDPRSEGWDGTLNGRLLPESDYWFKAVSFNGQEIQGHFTLKR